MKKKILTISMLVSGREETTEKSLRSLQPLREKLGAEIILTDTGCAPEYIEKIRGYADLVISFSWCNDFAKARNAGLEAAKGEWFMFIDDDEWFEDVTPIIHFFESGECQDYHQAVYIARNYSNFEGTEYSDDWVSRLIRIEDDTHFEGSVHECLMPVRGKCKRIEAFVHHYGYVFATEEERLAHLQRNVSILENLLEREPMNLKWPLQLLKEYYSVSDFSRILAISKEALTKLESVDEAFMNMCRGAFYIGMLMAEQQDVEAMWKAYDTFRVNEKNPWNVRCGIAAFMLLHGPEDEERLNICARDYENALKLHENEEYTEQEDIIADSIVFVKEYQKAIEMYISSIKEGVFGNGEFLVLPSRVWILARLGIMPLEEILLSLPFEQWLVQMHVIQERGFCATWSDIGNQLASICTKTDIRYTYFDVIVERMKMKQMYSLKENLEKMDFDTMTQILVDFAQANLNYMDYLYTDAAFDNDKELLLAEEKAALWIANGFSMDNTQWRERLQCFGEAAKIYPIMGDFVKRYMQLYGDSLTK